MALALRCFSRAFCKFGGSKTQATKMQRLRVPCHGSVADDLVEALMCFGASSCSIENASKDEVEAFDDGPVPWELAKRKLWTQSLITALFPPEDDVAESFAFAVDSLGLKEIPKYDVDQVEDCDWVQQVKDSFQPIQIATDFWIVPQWCTPPNPHSLNIFMDPGLAFGTGEHPTTRLCLRWLYKTIKGGERVLDYGTGSGILAIAALRMGASEAVGVDIDMVALSSASSNASLNGLELDKFRVHITSSAESDPLEASKFDVVVANILLNPLVSLASRISSYAKPGSLVALSGIILEQVPHVVETYAGFLDDLRTEEDDGWACVVGTRK